MVIHASLAAARVKKVADGKRYVLCGDFNIKPYDACYQLLTQGSLSGEFVDRTPSKPDGDIVAEKFSSTVEPPLKSAYVLANGGEPRGNQSRLRGPNSDTIAERSTRPTRDRNTSHGRALELGSRRQGARFHELRLHEAHGRRHGRLRRDARLCVSGAGLGRELGFGYCSCFGDRPVEAVPYFHAAVGPLHDRGGFADG